MSCLDAPLVIQIMQPPCRACSLQFAAAFTRTSAIAVDAFIPCRLFGSGLVEGAGKRGHRTCLGSRFWLSLKLAAVAELTWFLSSCETQNTIGRRSVFVTFFVSCISILVPFCLHRCLARERAAPQGRFAFCSPLFASLLLSTASKREREDKKVECKQNKTDRDEWTTSRCSYICRLHRSRFGHEHDRQAPFDRLSWRYPPFLRK